MWEMLRTARVYLLLLAGFTVGRWLQGTVVGTPYEKGHQVFSIVTLTLLSSLYYAAFGRAWRSWRLPQAMLFGLGLGLISQVVIWLATIASYAFEVDTYFRAPRALNVEAPVGFARAMVIRANGLLFNSGFTAIVAGLGWAMGGLLRDGDSKTTQG
jgi:membrane-bound metal-dependent hydrolase YbcI (DUF457 family)